MATAKSLEMVAQETAAIQAALETVSAAAKEYAQVSVANAGKTGIIELGEVTEVKRTLHQKAHQLLQAVRGPVDMPFSHQENVRDFPAGNPGECLRLVERVLTCLCCA